MNIEEQYSQMQQQLSGIEFSKLLEAQTYILEDCRRAIKDIKSSKQITDFLYGHWQGVENDEIKEFCKRHGFKAEIDFRNNTKTGMVNGRQKSQAWLVARLAYYWTLFLRRYEDFRIEIEPDNLQTPINIYSRKYDLRLHPITYGDKIEYIGFYPRSEMSRMDEIGIVKITMYVNQSQDPYHKGGFSITALYSTCKIVLKGDWWEVSENGITVLRTNTDKVDIIYDSASLSGTMPDHLILTQINLLERNNHKNDFILGSLNTFSRKEGSAYSSAIVLLEKHILSKRLACSINDEILRQLTKKNNPDTDKLADIRYFLFEQKIAINHSFNQIPFSDEVYEIRQFAGYYQCYCLAEENNELFLECILIKICTDGRILKPLLDDSNLIIAEVFIGFVKYINTNTGGVWRINLNYHEAEHVYEWVWSVQATRKYDRRFFKGVFLEGGFGLPKAGKIFLENIDISGISEMERRQKYDPTDPKWEATELRNFFSFGMEKNYLPAYRQFIPSQANPLPEFLRKKKYLVIYMAFIYEGNLDENKRRYIYRNINFARMPLQLLAGKGFELQVNEDETVIGNYEISHDKIILTVSNSAFFERFSFSLYGTDTSKKNFEYAFGIISGFNRSQNSEAKAAMLVAVSDKSESLFKVWENPKKLFKDDSLSKQDKKAITFLHTGRFNRIIHMPSKLNFEMKPAFDNTRRSLFYSAVHVWNNRDKHTVKEWDKEFYGDSPELLCVEYLRKALIRGFAVPEFLGCKRGELTYPQELRIDYNLLLDFISAIENESFKNEIIKLFDLNN